MPIEGSQWAPLSARGYRGAHLAPESVLSTAWFVSDSYSVATDTATEQDVAVVLHHLIAQLSDAGNEPFDFCIAQGVTSPSPGNNAEAEN